MNSYDQKLISLVFYPYCISLDLSRQRKRSTQFKNLNIQTITHNRFATPKTNSRRQFPAEKRFRPRKTSNIKLAGASVDTPAIFESHKHTDTDIYPEILCHSKALSGSNTTTPATP